MLHIRTILSSIVSKGWKQIVGRDIKQFLLECENVWLDSLSVCSEVSQTVFFYSKTILKWCKLSLYTPVSLLQEFKKNCSSFFHLGWLTLSITPNKRLVNKIESLRLPWREKSPKIYIFESFFWKVLFLSYFVFFWRCKEIPNSVCFLSPDSFSL